RRSPRRCSWTSLCWSWPRSSGASAPRGWRRRRRRCAPRGRRWWRSPARTGRPPPRSEEHTSELQSREKLVCRLLLEKKNNRINRLHNHKINLIRSLDFLSTDEIRMVLAAVLVDIDATLRRTIDLDHTRDGRNRLILD